MKLDRRESLQQFGALVTGASLTPGQASGGPPSDRLAPVLELINATEFEPMAKLALSRDQFEAISGGHRRSFDKMTLRQRLMVYAMDLDLTTELFGHQMFAPIIVGPVANQDDLHAQGELATARGAAAAKAVMVASSESRYPIGQIVAASSEPVWYQQYADAGTLRDDAVRAVGAGCTAICLTIGVSSRRTSVATDWNVVEQLAQTVDVPVVVKGVMSVDGARTAIQRGAQGLVVSSHGGHVGDDGALPIDVLPAVADAVNGQVPILVDGSFRRGTDVLKGLALGATAIMVARPPMWGLAAYGADGVQAVLELLQTELARNMAASGRPTIAMIDRELVRFDSR
jgi:4-hydroxymandelate oxidase